MLNSPIEEREKASVQIRVPLRISLIYALVSGIWILLSDHALALLFPDPADVTRFQTYKGWFFVASTSVMIYLLVRSNLKRLIKLQSEWTRSETRYRSLFELAPVAIFTKDLDGRYLSANPVVESDYVGRDPVGMTDHELQPGEIADQLRENDRQVVESGQQMVFRNQVNSPRGLREVLTYEVPLLDGQAEIEGVIGVAMDITQLVQLEEAERKQRLLAQTLQKTAETLASSLDLEDTLEMIIAELAKVTQFDRADLLLVEQENLRWVISSGEIAGAHPEKEAFPQEALPSLAETLTSAEMLFPEHLRRDPQLPRALGYQRGFSGWLGVPLVARDAAMGLLIVARKAPAYQSGEVGAVRAFASQAALAIERAHIVHELQASLNALRQAQDRLVRAARLSAIGELAAGIAHQINNPLMTAYADAHLLHSQFEPGDSGYEATRDIMTAAQEAGAIVQRLLDLSRSRPPDMEIIDVNESIQRAVSLFRPQIGSASIRLEADLASGLPAIEGSMEYLQDVWINLLLNARDALRDQDQGTIQVRSEYDPAGQVIHVSVADNGPGVPPEHMDKIFEPFFTTKDRGTGLGLSVCRDNVKMHGGEIELHSTPGVGARFRVTLPMRISQPLATLRGAEWHTS